MSFAGQLYQLPARRQVPDGSYVALNGPWDSFGVVRSSTPTKDGFLHLIRGVQKRALDKPVARF